MSFFVPTRFVWRFGGRQVHLCGSFTRWVETIPMAPVDSSPGVFAVVVHLPPGYHQYKFIVDGKWMHDETAPYMPDPLGNVNNWLFVRKIEPPANAQVQGLSYEQQQQLLQQAQLAQQQQQQAQAQQQQQQQAQAAQQQLQQQAAAVAAAAAAAQLQAQQQQQQQAAQLQQQQQQQAAAAAAAAPGAGLGAVHPSMQPPARQPAPGQASTPQQQQQPVSALHQQLVAMAGGGAPAAAGSPPAPEDVDMTAADPVIAPIICHSDREPDLTKKKVSDFLHTHSAYELIPESGKVVLLDADLPMRQAFHALYEQGTASAPLWDGSEGSVVGVISASDFIHTLRRLRSAISSGHNPMSEAEMDAHTIRIMRDTAAMEGRPPQALVYCLPEDQLAKVVRNLFDRHCSRAPILSCHPGDLEVPSVLHMATMGGILACLMRHFRASLASLPLLSQPLGALPIGTWSPDCQGLTPVDEAVAMEAAGSSSSGGNGSAGGAAGSGDAGRGARRAGRHVKKLHTVTPTTPLTTALALLLEAGVSSLPVTDADRVLLDIYARADITQLCKGNAYNRLQWEDVTVGQALSLSSSSPAAWNGHHDPHQQQPGGHSQQQLAMLGGAGGGPKGITGRVAVTTREEPLRSIVEKLSLPGVRRLVVVEPTTRRVEGIVSLSDVAAYLFL